MAAAEEDFSFPATTTDTPPRFVDSPPLWRCSPSPSPSPTASPTSHRVKPEKLKGKQLDDEESFVLRSFQELRASSVNRRSGTSRDEDEEEKMDMLWEDLNDELSRNCGKTSQNSDVSSPGREVRINCVKALKLSKTNGHVISGKKQPSVLVFIRVLKKVFLMHSSHHLTIKKRSC